MTPTIYVVNVKDHPEFPHETMVGESPESVARVYIQGYSVPIEYTMHLRIYDCYAANMYVLEQKNG